MNPHSGIPVRSIPGYESSIEPRALAGIVALHLVLALGLLNLEPVARSVGLPQPLMVSLLSAPEPEPPSAPAVPTPRQTRVLSLPETSAIAAREDVPVAASASAQPSEPIPASNLPPESAPTKPADAPAPPPVVTTVPPRFDAAYLDNPAPSYPALSQRLREHGRVLLRVYVSPEGRAVRVMILESSGYDRLDRAAQDAVQRWRFVPAHHGDKPVADWVQVPIDFFPSRG